MCCYISWSSLGPGSGPTRTPGPSFSWPSGVHVLTGQLTVQPESILLALVQPRVTCDFSQTSSFPGLEAHRFFQEPLASEGDIRWQLALPVQDPLPQLPKVCSLGGQGFSDRVVQPHSQAPHVNRGSFIVCAQEEVWGGKREAVTKWESRL